MNQNKVCWCGSVVEQLIRNQQVVGSIPTTSSIVLLFVACLGKINKICPCKSFYLPFLMFVMKKIHKNS